jgi:putative ABC transport system permease protein
MVVNSSASSLFWVLIRRALWVRRSRILVMFMALLVGAMMICAMAALYLDIDAKMSRELRTFGANLYVGPKQGHAISENMWLKATALPSATEVQAAGGFLYGMARTEQESVVLMGGNFESLAGLSPYWQITGDRISVSFDDRNAMIGKKLAERLELKPGDTVTLIQDSRRHTLHLKGIVEAGDATDYYLIVNLSLAQNWLNRPGEISHGLMSIDNQNGQVDKLAAQMAAAYPELEVRPIRKVSANEGAVLFKIQGLMGMVAVVILLLSTLCVNTTLMALIGERSREFALQKALGASKKSIVGQIVTETLLVTSVAVMAGLVLGWILAQLLGQTVFSSAINMRWPVIPLTFLVSLLVAGFAAVMPVRRALALEPARILKGE